MRGLVEVAFREYGLPRTIRSDNGPPFASVGSGGLSPFAVKLVKAGVVLERIDLGQPQQNGRLEWLHLTLKQETASPPASSLRQQGQRFAAFQTYYNPERPHGVSTVLIPANGARLTVDGEFAGGRPFPRMRDAATHSTCALAFSESWTLPY